MIVDPNFSYEPLRLSVLKLDASSFHVEVARTATVAELKQAVEAAFSYMPQKGTGKISWPHVWGQFCLCYDGHKLVTDTDYLRDYGIRDGDQLHFMRHVSNTCSFQKMRLKKGVVNLKQRRSYKLNTGIIIDYGKIQHCNVEEYRIGKSRLTDIFGGLFSDTRMAVVRRARNEGGIYLTKISRGIVSSLGKLEEFYVIAGGSITLGDTPGEKIDRVFILMILFSSMHKDKRFFNRALNNAFGIVIESIMKNLPGMTFLYSCNKAFGPGKNEPGVAASSLALAPPSLAAEIEKAALFDFNLTLPIIMAEFLLLMVALDKIYFTPLGKFMDERDSAIREKLNSVKDTSAEVKQLEEQANAVMKAARAEISAALNKMKKETQAEVEQKLAEGRQKVDAELQEALANLEKQKAETIKALDSQITALSQDIVKKVLPTA
ncbi:Ubiquitin-like domain superfamily [Sesbania bispinosa]|nr:Ubiquitin-like domain superfamily [Sesbania bispinosa]